MGVEQRNGISCGKEAHFWGFVDLPRIPFIAPLIKAEWEYVARGVMTESIVRIGAESIIIVFRRSRILQGLGTGTYRTLRGSDGRSRCISEPD